MWLLEYAEVVLSTIINHMICIGIFRCRFHFVSNKLIFKEPNEIDPGILKTDSQQPKSVPHSVANKLWQFLRLRGQFYFFAQAKVRSQEQYYSYTKHL